MIKNNPQDFMPKDDKLHGIYRGVVEDNKDPEKMGRCKIRIFGVHTEKKLKEDLEGIPTEELPWSEPVLSLFEGSVSGFGQWTVPLQGSHVFLFFENGNILQPRFFASIPGKPTDVNHGFKDDEGFSDPNKQYPTKHRLNEPDWHRLARDEFQGTIVDYKNDNRKTGVKNAMGQGEWDEPEPYYKKSEEKYPNNNVIATHRGLIVELDSSDNPRLHIYHPSNSFIEIDNDGNKVIKNTGNKYTIVMKDDNHYVKESYNSTADNDRTEMTGGDKYSQVDGDVNGEVGGDVTIEIGGENSITIGGSCSVDIGGDCDVNVGGNCNITAGGNVTVQASSISFN